MCDGSAARRYRDRGRRNWSRAGASGAWRGTGGTGGSGGSTGGSGPGDIAQAITAGSVHACALLTDGTVACWGENDWGQLGDGTNTGPDNCAGQPCSTAPVAVNGIANATEITAGEAHTCALLTGGTIDCWGENLSGQLGDGTDTGPDSCGGSACSTTPVRVTGITNAIQVAAGGEQTCALLTDGTVDCWGDNSYGELGGGTDTGPNSCAAGVNGAACSTTPVQVTGITNAIQIAVGGQHTCALLAGGSVDCWGDNQLGELGDGTDTGPDSCTSGAACSTTPVAVSGILNATEITADESGETGVFGGTTCALLTSDTIDCWGLNTVPTGGPDSTPVAVSGITAATQIAASSGDTCALVVPGSLDCWGDNSWGQLGDGGLETGGNVPISVSGITDATQVAVGYLDTCALLGDGGIDCWGDNRWGGLGDGTFSGAPSLVPVPVTGFQ